MIIYLSSNLMFVIIYPRAGNDGADITVRRGALE